MLVFNILLYTVSPFQRVLDHKASTHEWLLRQAIGEMEQNGAEKVALFFKNFESYLIQGAYWADEDWKNVHHYYEFTSGKGLWRFHNALTEFAAHYRQARRALNQCDLAKGFFYLGAAAHLMQDMCVPHHVQNQVFSGHQEFENWVRAHLDMGYEWQRESQTGRGLKQCIHYNIETAASWFDEVKMVRDGEVYETAAGDLIPLAVQSTIQLYLEFWLEICRLSLYKVNVA